MGPIKDDVWDEFTKDFMKMSKDMKSLQDSLKGSLMKDFKHLSGDRKRLAEKIQNRMEMNAKRGVRRPKFYPDDPDDHWDTGKMSNRDKETLETHYRPIGSFKDYRKPRGWRWDKLVDSVREPEPERELTFSLENFGRRIRKMSAKISIPVIPMLIIFWAVGGFDIFFDEDEKEITKPTVEVTEKKTFKEEVVGVMESIEKNIIPAAKEKWAEAKEELKSDKPDPDPIPVAKVESDPYTQDDRYGNTDSKY